MTFFSVSAAAGPRNHSSNFFPLTGAPAAQPSEPTSSQVPIGFGDLSWVALEIIVAAADSNGFESPACALDLP
jgi:hypothetical protein